VVPDLSGMTVSEAESTAEELGFDVTIHGAGDNVTDQLPAANATVAAGSEIIIYTEGAAPADKVTVPDIYGLTYDEARQRLSYYGIYVKYTAGSSTANSTASVSQQSIQAGTPVRMGTIVEVTLSDQSNLGYY